MKNVLVTGASRGIGRVIAEILASDYNVYGTARNENLLKGLPLKGYCVCDLSNEDELERLSEFIKSNNIDILINNAGEYVYSGVEDMSYSQIIEMYKINSIAPLYLMSACVPYMKSKMWGRIINIGSISGVMGEAFASCYSATKSSLIGLAKASALELAQFNITVNTVNPGWVDTELGENSINESEFTKEEILECVPQKRFVDPSEIANFIKYLISEQAKGITGQSINLCAGLSVGY